MTGSDDDVEPGERVASVESIAIEKSERHGLVFGVSSSIVAALLFWGVALSDVEYFTTWALFVHGTYFAIVGIDAVFFGGRRFIGRAWQHRWVFVPCLTIAIAVAVSVTYLLYVLWEDEANEEHCADTMACRDLFVEFILAHYFPPIAYLGLYVAEDVRAGNSRRRKRTEDRRPTRGDDAYDETDESSSRSSSMSSKSSRSPIERWYDGRARYSIAAFQISLVPTLVYSSFMNPDAVYGSGTNSGGVAVYAATALSCSFFIQL